MDRDLGQAEDDTPSLLNYTDPWLRTGVMEQKLQGVARGLPTSIFLLPVTSIINKKTIHLPIFPFDSLHSLQGLFLKVLDETIMCKLP